MARSIDSFAATSYINCFNIKYAFKKWRVISKKFQKFNRIFRKILCKKIVQILFSQIQNLKLYKNFLVH